MKINISTVLLSAALSLNVLVSSSPIAPSRLSVNYFPHSSETLNVVNPNGNLYFSWRNEHGSKRNVTQSSARVLLTSNFEYIYDSGFVSTSSSVISYFGPSNGYPLQANRKFEWSVQWTDDKGKVSSMSKTSFFYTGPTESMWNETSWIGNNQTMVYRTFTHSPSSENNPIFAFVSGLGFFQFYLNGKRVDRDMLNGAWTTFNERTLYYTYEITHLLNDGQNVVGLMLGQGWRERVSFPPFWKANLCSDTKPLMLRLAIVDSLSSKLIVGSDNQWLGILNGPVVSSSIYNGEVYDARIMAAQQGWNKINFSPSSEWSNVPLVEPDCFNPTLTPLSFPGIGVDETNPALSITRMSGTSQVVDFGFNLSGFCKIFVKGEAGTNITLKYAEILIHLPYGNRTGDIYQGNLRSAKSTDIYILEGKEEGEFYMPHFTYHGFRYVEVLNYPGDLHLSNIQQINFRTMNPQTTFFHSSSDVINRIQFGTLKSQASNQMSVPTDCPQRDERLGWMGDASLSSNSMMLNFDSTSFFSNYLVDMVDSQNPLTGSLPEVVPMYKGLRRPGDPSWTAAFPQCLYTKFIADGDLEQVLDIWENIMLYLKNIRATIDSSGMAKVPSPYGDWVTPKNTQKGKSEACSAFNFIRNLKQASEMAKALGKLEDEAFLIQSHNDMQKEYKQTWYNSTDNIYSTLQSDTSLAFQVDLITEEVDIAAAKSILKKSFGENDMHLTTGIIGVKVLFPTLVSLGMENEFLNLLRQTSYPSFGYMFFNDLEPATSNLWELWYAPTEGDGMNSRNHHMFSSVSEYIIRFIGGINNASPSIACGNSKEVIQLTPAKFLEISHAHTTLKTRCGEIELNYKREGGKQCLYSAEGTSSLKPYSPKVKDGHLSCGKHGGVISSVDFASWGFPIGVCGSFSVESTCHAPESLLLVSELCLGKSECFIPSNADFFPSSSNLTLTCKDNSGYNSSPRALAVEITCSKPASLFVSSSIPVGNKALLTFPALNTNDIGYELFEEEIGLVAMSEKQLIFSHDDGIEKVNFNGKIIESVQIHSGMYNFHLIQQQDDLVEIA